MTAQGPHVWMGRTGAECPIALDQNGDKLTGAICGRGAKTDLSRCFTA